ncbi:AzlC family ABC transporter permease [Modestobacter marinus]|uniref:AzlC family ABC transporter permease n=1 Tax=Modestobacter marinus TaxID=477641 RepID=UPI001C95ACF5|nr:AzlC family ABC transporter permease [Modestobacter marinus]
MTAAVLAPDAAVVDSRRLALRDARTVAPGLLPFGMLLGVTVVSTGASGLAGVLGGPIVYGGSAQLTALTLLDRGLGLAAVVLSAAVVNARLLLYSAALGHRFRAQPALFRWLAPHFIIDQTYLMADSHPELAGRDFRRYWTWLGGTVLVVWTGSIALGVVLAPMLPPLPHLTLVGTAMFLGLLVPRLVDRPAVVAAVVGGGVAAAVSWVLPAAGIVAGAVAGVAAAMAVSRDD